MSHALKQLADGRWVRADGKPDDIVRDGEAVRVPMIMLDGKASIDSQPVSARDRYVKRLNDGWVGAAKQPQPVITAPLPAPVVKPIADASRPGQPTPAYLAYCKRLEDGYRHAVNSTPGRAA